MSEYKKYLEEVYRKEDEAYKKFLKPGLAALVIALILFGIMFLLTRPIIAGGMTTGSIVLREVSQSDIDQARQDRDNARSQAQHASEMVDQLRSQRNRLTGELADLNEANEAQKAQYELIAAQLEAALEAKAQALDEYIQAEENLAQQELLFQERVSVMFEYQNKSTLEVLLESDNLAGFFTNMEIITLIADSDVQAIDQMQIALDDAALQKEIKLQEAQDMQDIADEKQRQLDELAELIKTTEDTLSDVSTRLSSWQMQEDSLLAYADSMDDQVRALQDQYAAEHATPTPVPQTQATTAAATSSGGTGSTDPTQSSGSGSAPAATATPTPAPASNGAPSLPASPSVNVSFVWPTNGRSVTSYFGYRWHPVYGTWKLHTGIDIGGGYGATLMAAASGTVISVSEPVEGRNTGGSGYGNYCIIDHGNGVTTLYGHARDITVHVGDTVSAGQTIGEMGSTGTSTGAHLHFEVRVNGTRYDPLDYLP